MAQNRRPVPFMHRLVDVATWTKTNQSKADEKVTLEKVWFTENNIFFPDKQYPQPQTTYVSCYMAYIPGVSTKYKGQDIPPFSDGETIEMVKGFLNSNPYQYKIKFHRILRDNSGTPFNVVLGLLRV